MSGCETVVRWTEGGRAHSARLRARRWAKLGRDRLYVVEVLPDGTERRLGNFDLQRGAWFTERGTSIGWISPERGEATKAFVLDTVRELQGEPKGDGR